MQSAYSHVHLIGIGGIHVSAIAKLLLSLGVKVSGSDVTANEQTAELEARGVKVWIGHAKDHVPAETQALVFSSAARKDNPEREEGERRGLPAWNSHEFLGVLGAEMKQIVVTGTHGKSTTTAMLALMAEAVGLDPTVVVGTRVPQLAEGNLRGGASDWLIVEGDEFDRHFLAYHPTILAINNIEGDHFDVYPTVDAMVAVYRELIAQVVSGGWIIANGDDEHVKTLIEEVRPSLESRGISVSFVGANAAANVCVLSRTVVAGRQRVKLTSGLHGAVELSLGVPGAMNAMNAAMCYAVGERLNANTSALIEGLEGFTGIWRRLEKVAEKNDHVVFSDYGHHPTAVTKTLEAIKDFYPDRRIVLCFQPHHRNRTKHLFEEFVSCFDLADELILCEIYDVQGRDEAEDQQVSSEELLQAIEQYDTEQGVSRPLTYAKTPSDALTKLRSLVQPHDVILVMGAGDIYKIASQIL